MTRGDSLTTTQRAGMALARVMAALAAVALFVPLQPVLPATGLDPSWKIAINQAVSQHLSFGDQLVFSLGPWASIYTQSYHPATDRMMLIGPEGDFTEREIEQALKKDFVPVTLGNTRLRTETAGIVAATLLCAAT